MLIFKNLSSICNFTSIPERKVGKNLTISALKMQAPEPGS
jgi:hypothetical protein